MIHDLLYGSCGLAGWISFAYKLNHVRKHWHDPALRAICAAFGFCALGFTLTAGIVFRPLDALIGIPNLTKLLIHGSMVFFSAYVLRLLAFWRHDAQECMRTRIPLLLGSLAVAAMTTLILLAPIHNAYNIHFWKSYAGQRYMAWYLTIFLVSFGVALLEIGRHSWKYANDAGDSPWLRRGLRITTIGAYTALGYCLCRGSYLLALQAHTRIEVLVDLAIPLVSLGNTLCFVGLTMPSWGPHLANRIERRTQLHSYRSLHPLWFALYQAFPTIALHPAKPPDDQDSVGDLDYLLYRRMIEIRDGLLILRSYLGENDTNLDTTTENSLHRRAALEAQRIHRGLSAMLRDEGADSPASMIEFTGADTATDELAWLVAVSHAFAQLPGLDEHPGGEPTSSSTDPQRLGS
jgi:hypothetical protein